MKTNIIVSLIIILTLLACQDNESGIGESKMEFVPGEIAVGIKTGIDIKSVFNFINQYDFNVDRIYSLTFTSDLPHDKLQYILDQLNTKSYTNDGTNWFVTGYMHYQTN